VIADEQSQSDKASEKKQESTTEVPDLANFVPLTAKLSGRLAVLEIEIAGLPDVSAIERKHSGIEANLKGPVDELQRLKVSGDYRYNELVALKEGLEQENASLEEISEPLRQSIRQLGAWREEWLEEKGRWDEWQASLVREGAFDQFKSIFAKANGTIDTALNLVLRRLEVMLSAQEKAGNIQAQIRALDAELDGLIVASRLSVLMDKSPPILSSRYFSQFGSELWHAVQKGLKDISWPDSRFFDRQGWILLLQGSLSLLVVIAVYRNRQVLKDSKRLRFLAERPLSAGLFLGVIAASVLYAYSGAPKVLEVVNTIVGGLSLVRLSGGVIAASWKRQFVYGVIMVLIVTRLMDAVSLPLPLLRLYMVLTALVGLLFCFRWAGESARRKDPGFYAWSLRLGSFLLVVIIIAELWGKEKLAGYLFVSSIGSIVFVISIMLFVYMIRGGVEWVFRDSPLRHMAPLPSDADALIRRVSLFIEVAIWGLLLLPAILVLWGVYDTPREAMKGLLAFGFNVKSVRISVGLLIVLAGILYGSFLASWILQRLLLEKVLLGLGLERGVRLSIKRLVHYAIIVAGFLLALSTLGFELTQFTIMLSALGVGIGFGLQGIVNNFVSGFILLFERPLRVGDIIELGGNWAEIKRIGLRATTVRTFDQADVIIPNADLVNSQVTNWTLSSRQIRLIIPVGVAYGSDVALVMETLMACAGANAKVLQTPPPQVLFLSFGESTLDFDLRVWVVDADDRLEVTSELHQEIDRSFREAKIEIAFPQRDLHLRSLDESVTLRPPETAG
jgi:small-conductance mechanosensitive channel